MPNTTRTEIPAEVNNFYDRALLERALPALVHRMFGQIRDIPRNAGTDTIKFRRYGALAVQTTPLTEGVTPPGKQLSVTDLTALVKYYGDYVTLTDKVLTETIDPILAETAEVLGEQAGESLEEITRDIEVAGTTVQYASTATARNQVTAAMVLNQAEVKETVRTLQNNNVKKVTSRVDPSTGYNTTPLNAAFIGIIHPNTLFDLKSATGWIPVEKYPNKSDVMPYEAGALDEVRFVVCSKAKVFSGAGSGGVDVYATLIFGKNAFGHTRISGESLRNIVKALGSAGTADPLEQRSTSGWKATDVTARLNESFVVRVEHGVTA